MDNYFMILELVMGVLAAIGLLMIEDYLLWLLWCMASSNQPKHQKSNTPPNYHTHNETIKEMMVRFAQVLNGRTKQPQNKSGHTNYYEPLKGFKHSPSLLPYCFPRIIKRHKVDANQKG